MPLEMLTAGLVAFGAASFFTPLARWAGPRFGMIDHPNHRSSHYVPTPRTGGLAIFAAVLLGAIAGGSTDLVIVLLACALFAVILISAVDDRYTIPHTVRLLVQIVSAGIAVSILNQFDQLPFVSVTSSLLVKATVLIFAAFFVVGLTNGFNFMDGINGIAALGAIVSTGVFALLFARHGDIPAAVAAIAIGAAAAGYLPWNFPGGSIFMGDVGSAGLGFSVAVLALRLSAAEPLPVALLPLLPFLLDTGVTLTRRILAGERFLSAHRSHYYQRLMISGVAATWVTLIWTALSVVGAATALYYIQMSVSARAAVITVLLIAHVLVAIYATRRWQRAVAATSAS